MSQWHSSPEGNKPSSPTCSVQFRISNTFPQTLIGGKAWGKSSDKLVRRERTGKVLQGMRKRQDLSQNCELAFTAFHPFVPPHKPLSLAHTEILLWKTLLLTWQELESWKTSLPHVKIIPSRELMKVDVDNHRVVFFYLLVLEIPPSKPSLPWNSLYYPLRYWFIYRSGLCSDG